jgi:transposase-like protein
VYKEALRTWVRQAKADAADGTPTVLSSAEREELKRLRQVRELRQANEILRPPASISLLTIAPLWRSIRSRMNREMTFQVP